MIRIEIHDELPPKELSPNYSRYAHWGVRARARTEWREIVYYSAINEAIRCGEKLPYKQAKLRWTFIYRTKRKRDADNLLSSCKVAQDCLVEAGIIEADDVDHLMLEPIKVIVDKERAPMTVIELKRVRWEVVNNG